MTTRSPNVARPITFNAQVAHGRSDVVYVHLGHPIVQRSQRLLRLLSRDSGPVTLGYVAEAPLWRVSYRLILEPTGKSGVLQGWALLHNDTDEDWRRVQVHLVNGQPDSFLFPLAAPRYSRRPLLTPDNELSTVPQLLGTNADTLWGDHIEEAYGAGGLGLTGTGSGGGGTGEGTIGLGRIGTIGHGSGAGVSGSSSLLQVGNLAASAQATGVESAAQFTYSLTDPLDLRAHGSALVPFVQEPVEVEAITWLESPGSPARSGVRLQNNTRQTLPVGTLAVFAEGGLAGETTLDRLKPGEKRFVQYGVDLDVELLDERGAGAGGSRHRIAERAQGAAVAVRLQPLGVGVEHPPARPRRQRIQAGLEAARGVPL